MKTFSDVDKCREFVKSLKIFSVRKHNETAKYTVIYYRCNLVPSSGLQCDHQMKILIYKNDVKEEVYENEAPHTHDKIKTKKLSEETKTTILNMHIENLSSNQIQQIGPDSSLSTRQIRNVISNHKKKLNMIGDVDMATIEKWCIENSKKPDDDYEPYVVKYEISHFNEEPSIRFVYTSKILLKNIDISKLLGCDATYKLSTLDIPLYVLGTLDAANHFHYIAIGCCTHEKTDDYIFYFSAIKEAAIDNYIEMSPEVLLSDGSLPIINAFYNVFESSAHTNNMCHVHVMRNAVKHLESDESLKGNKAEKKRIVDMFKEDFVLLQTSSTEEKFKIAYALFKEKYEKISKTFIDYFDKQWIRKPLFSNWYEGANKFVMANNALEAENGVIKKNFIRSKLPFGIFVQRLYALVSHYSKMYSSSEDGEKKFVATIPEIDESMWRVMYIFISINSILLKHQLTITHDEHKRNIL